MKSKRKMTSLAIAGVMALSCLTTGIAMLPTTASAEGTTTVQGITYNADDFTVTQDYGAYVDGVVYTYPSAAGTAAGSEFRKVGSKVRLDAGRNGLLFTSKATGDDVEGKSVSLANKQLGDFTMDFRVFSQQTAVGHAYTEAAKGTKAGNYWENSAVYNDEHNPFQDIRRVDITFTSVSNPNAKFTVYIFGNDTESTWTDCSAIVNVPGDYEGQTSGYIGGYGLCYDGCGYVCYGKSDGANGHFKGHRTRLPGTSFTNVSKNTSSMPTSIWFDAETLKVYGKCYTETLNELGTKGSTVTEEYRLIRDMTANPYAEAGINSWGSQTLNPADFEAGYTVDIAVGEMTSNSTALKQPVWSGDAATYSEQGLLNATNASPYYRCSAEEFDVDGDGNVDTNYTYDRYANFIIYDINGAEMDVKDGWTVEETTLTTVNAGKYDCADGGPFAEPTWSGTDQYNKNVAALAQFGYAPGDVLQGLKFTSKVNNNGVVGEGFDLNVDEFTNDSGAFAMKIGAEFDVSKSVNKWNAMTSSMNMEKRGLGDYAEAIDQYSDVKEIKITFRSTVDTTKAFNVYMVSRTSANNAIAIYTEIEGENYINSTMHRGWALNWGEYTYGFAQGTFGSRTVNLYGETDDTYCYPLIKFDPATMNISGLSAQNVPVYRTLSTAYTVAGTTSATLNAADFYSNGESTYTVTVSVERMNTKENYGVNTLSYFNGSWSTWTENIYASGSAPTEGWDHTAKIHVYKLYDKTTLAQESASTKAAQTGKTELDLGNSLTFNSTWKGIEITANVINTFGVAYKPESVSYTGASTGTVELVDGVGIFKPTAEGTYTFTVGNMSRTVTLTYQTAGSVSGYTVTAEEDLGLNFYVSIDGATSAVASMQMDGKAAQQIDGAYDSAKSLWRFTYPVAAKDYDKSVSMSLVALDGANIAKGVSDSYSVSAYANGIVSGDYSQEAKTLAQSLITYGEAAKVYFDETLAASAVKVTDRVIAKADLADKQMNLVGEDANVEMQAATLALESKTVIGVYFTAADANTVCTVNGEAVEAEAVAGEENLYIVKVSVDAKDLGDMYEITVGGYTLTFGAYSYIELIVDGVPAALYNVLQALYDYGVNAQAYLG